MQDDPVGIGHAIERRKIDPSRRPASSPAAPPATPPATRPDGSPDDNDRAEIGPTRNAFAEWAAAGLAAPDLAAMRAHRHARLVAALAEREYGGLLLFDPLNIRYATDSTNLQLWNTHNPFRAVLLAADRHIVFW